MQAPALIFALAGVLGGVQQVHAAEAAPAKLVLEVASSCEELDAAQLRRLLDVEVERDATSLRGAEVSVSCEAGQASLRVARVGSATEGSRTFALADVAGEVGARVLALAAIELLNDAARVSEVKPEPLARPEPAPAPVVREPAPPAPPTVRLMAGASIQTVAFDQTLMGGGLSVDFLRWSRLGLRLGLDLAFGGRDSELGRARIQLTTMSAQVGYFALYERWTARAMLGYRFGSGRIAGEAADPVAREGTVSGPWGGPLLSTGLGLRSGRSSGRPEAARSWVAELAGEAGLVSFPLEGTLDADSPIQLDGYWLGLSLSVGALL